MALTFALDIHHALIWGGSPADLIGGLLGLLLGLVFSLIILLGIHEPNSSIYCARKLQLEPTMLKVAFGITVNIDDTVTEAVQEEKEDRKHISSFNV